MIFLVVFLCIASPVGGVVAEHTVEWLLRVQTHVGVEVRLAVRLVPAVQTLELTYDILKGQRSM